MTITKEFKITEENDQRDLVIISKHECEALGKMIYSLRLQVETLEKLAQQSGIDTWCNTSRVETVASYNLKANAKKD
jgi:hypothetical protein